ncbi:MAG: thiamine pyrophosphate-dependent enzyme [Candidatus Nealsonbacteria bacterium]
MKPETLNTKAENTWCPGCPDSNILKAFKEAVSELVNEGKIKIKNTAIVTGIGCHAKLYDYVDLNGFYGIHGRVLPIAFGIKSGNPELTVVGFGGDGDTYAEGIAHFVHACRYNMDMTMLVLNNQTFSLTTGQATPTSEKGFVGASTPYGQKEQPLNPINVALESGAGFVARGYALDVPHLKNLIKKAVEYKGFSYIDILQPCITYHNTIPYFQKNVYKLDEKHDAKDLNKALEKGGEWDYSFNCDKKVPIGVFYENPRSTFEEQREQMKKPWYKIDRKIIWDNEAGNFK